jgi:hypothetical protein
MPKKLRLVGGQTRNVICPCGYSVKGSLREVEKRIDMHTKTCPVCKCHIPELPEFNKDLAVDNGRITCVGNSYKNGNKTALVVSGNDSTVGEEKFTSKELNQKKSPKI